MSETVKVIDVVDEPAPEAPKLELVSGAYQDDEREDVVEGRWRVENMDSADWALRRLGELEAEIEENEALAAKRIEEIQERTKRLNARAGRGVAFFRNVLAEFAQSNREALLGGGKKKTRSLPSGSISFRKTGGDLKTVDREALLAWAVQQPVELGLVRVKEEPALNEIKAHAKASDIVPPGMQREPEEEEVIVKAERKAVL